LKENISSENEIQQEIRSMKQWLDDIYKMVGYGNIKETKKILDNLEKKIKKLKLKIK
jgi:hypothetical protein